MAKLSWILQSCSFLGQCCDQIEFCFPCHVRACYYIPQAHYSMSPTDKSTWLHTSLIYINWIALWSSRSFHHFLSCLSETSVDTRNADTSLPVTFVPQIFSFRWTQEGGIGEGHMSWTQVGGQMMQTESRRRDRNTSREEVKDVVRATKNKFNIDESHYPWAAWQTAENHTDPSGTWFIIRYYYWKVNITKY